jgi:D-alanyl-D-alanine carboxypeptidase (penicillin-binding protein 5/6)
VRRPARRSLVAALAALATLGGVAGGRAQGAPAPPDLSAEAAILVDARNGDVMAARAPEERRPIASATKLMTALLALERAKPDQVFTAPGYRASSVESQIGLRAGEHMTVRDLLVGLLLESANDAAVTIADGISGSERAFVDLMNRRARELGLRDTHFANPIGFDDPRNYSSARDLAALAGRLLRDPRFSGIVDQPRATLTSGSRRRVVQNRNRLVGRYPEVSGVKTGHTAGAGYVLVGSATRRDAAVVSIVLGAASESARDRQSLALLRFGLDQFQPKRVLRAGRPVASAELKHSDGERATLTTPDDVRITVRRDGPKPDTRVAAPAELEGPLPERSRVGSVEVLYGGEVVETAPLVTARAVPEVGTWDRLTSTLNGPLTYVGLAVIVCAGALALALVRSRSQGRRTRDDHHSHA